MKIAIIGHGNVGGALAKSWAQKGHDIIIGVRKEKDEKAAKLVNQPNTSTASIPEAAKQADVILVAIPAKAAGEVAKTLGDVSDKVLIDATNNIRQPDTAFDVFKAETKAEVVKCFNTTGYENMRNPVYGMESADMFMAGDSERAKRVAKQLALDAGFAECYDFGGDDQAKALEHLAYAWINLAIFQEHGRNMAFKMLRR